MPRPALTAGLALAAGLLPGLPAAGGAAAAPTAPATWRPFAPIPRASDVVGPRRDGAMVVGPRARSR